MVKIKVAVLISSIIGLLVSCGPALVPFEEACDHMDKKIIATGYLATTKFSSPGFCGVILVPRWQVVCNFDLYGQPDRKGEKIEIAFFLPDNNLHDNEVIEILCNNEPSCTLDGTSQFSIVGVIEPADHSSWVCNIDVYEFKDIRFNP